MEITSYIESFLAYLNTLPGIVLLLFFGFSNFLENIFPPWPGDTFTVFSGFLVSKPDSSFSLGGLVFCTILGNWLGALLMFHFGKRVVHFLKHTNHKLLRNLYEEDAFLKTVEWFRKYSGLLIIFSRFSAGIRFFVAIVAGMSRMNAFLFLFYYSISITLWCGILIGSGYKLGKNWDQISVILATYNQIITVFLVLLFTLSASYYFYRKKEQS